MSPDAYYYISFAYVFIAIITALSLVIKRCKHPEWVEYVLHGLHIPPYLIASYWYWDAYSSH
jgi:hypothetical protein